MFLVNITLFSPFTGRKFTNSPGSPSKHWFGTGSTRLRLLRGNRTSHAHNLDLCKGLLKMQLKSRGGHSHRRRVQSCDRGQDAVKRSRHFLGVGQTVKQCSGALSTALLPIKRRDRSFCACAVDRWSRVKGKNPAWSSGQGRFSTVKNLDPGRSSGHSAYGSDPPLSNAAQRENATTPTDSWDTTSTYITS